MKEKITKLKKVSLSLLVISSVMLSNGAYLVEAKTNTSIVENVEVSNLTDNQLKALNEAKVVFDNPNATQKEVDNAKDVLEKAISGLQTVTVDNTVKTPVSNGDTTTSVKTGDDVNMLGTLGLISSLGVIAYLKKKKEK